MNSLASFFKQDIAQGQGEETTKYINKEKSVDSFCTFIQDNLDFARSNDANVTRIITKLSDSQLTPTQKDKVQKVSAQIWSNEFADMEAAFVESKNSHRDHQKREFLLETCAKYAKTHPTVVEAFLCTKEDTEFADDLDYLLKQGHDQLFSLCLDRMKHWTLDSLAKTIVSGDFSKEEMTSIFNALQPKVFKKIMPAIFSSAMKPHDLNQVFEILDASNKASALKKRDENEYNLLQYAVDGRSRDAIVRIIQKYPEAELFKKDAAGNNPLDTAFTDGHGGIIATLVKNTPKEHLEELFIDQSYLKSFSKIRAQHQLEAVDAILKHSPDSHKIAFLQQQLNDAPWIAMRVPSQSSPEVEKILLDFLQNHEGRVAQHIQAKRIWNEDFHPALLPLVLKNASQLKEEGSLEKLKAFLSSLPEEHHLVKALTSSLTDPKTSEEALTFVLATPHFTPLLANADLHLYKPSETGKTILHRAQSPAAAKILLDNCPPEMKDSLFQAGLLQSLIEGKQAALIPTVLKGCPEHLLPSVTHGFPFVFEKLLADPDQMHAFLQNLPEPAPTYIQEQLTARSIDPKAWIATYQEVLQAFQLMKQSFSKNGEKFVKTCVKHYEKRPEIVSGILKNDPNLQSRYVTTSMAIEESKFAAFVFTIAEFSNAEFTSLLNYHDAGQLSQLANASQGMLRAQFAMAALESSTNEPEFIALFTGDELEALMQPDQSGSSLFHYMVYYASPQRIQTFYSICPESIKGQLFVPNKLGETPLSLALTAGNERLLPWLIKQAPEQLDQLSNLDQFADTLIQAAPASLQENLYMRTLENGNLSALFKYKRPLSPAAQIRFDQLVSDNLEQILTNAMKIKDAAFAGHYLNNATIWDAFQKNNETMQNAFRNPALASVLFTDKQTELEDYIASRGGYTALTKEEQQAYLPVLKPSEIQDYASNLTMEEIGDWLDAAISFEYIEGGVSRPATQPLLDAIDLFATKVLATINWFEPENVAQEDVKAFLNKVPMSSLTALAIVTGVSEDVLEFLPIFSEAQLAVTIPHFDTDLLIEKLRTTDDIEKRALYLRFANVKQKEAYIKEFPMEKMLLSNWEVNNDLLTQELNNIKAKPDNSKAIALQGLFTKTAPGYDVNKAKSLVNRLATSLWNKEITPELDQTIAGEKQKALQRLEKIEQELSFLRTEIMNLKTIDEAVEVPEEYQDGITYALMNDPVKLPGMGESDVWVDRSSIRVQVGDQWANPFTRQLFAYEEFKTDEALKQKIDTWKEQQNQKEVPQEPDLPAAPG